MQSRATRWILSLSLLPASGLMVGQLQAQDGDDPPSRVARISYLSGDVSLQASYNNEWAEAPPNYPMVAGDRLYTAPSSRALVQLGGAELRIGQGTDLTLTNLSDEYEQLALAQGSVRLRVFQMDPGSQIEVDTPNGALLVEGPGDYRIDADPQDGDSDVIVTSGNAQLTGPNVNLPLPSGYAMQMAGTNPIQLQYMDFPEYDALDTWSMSLDQRMQNSISARYVSRQMVGYSDLDANGTWVPQSEYGPVWYPNNVPEGWRPYSAGHWAYVAPWGYTWVDDASWGFAPFHYGRWAVVEGRWGWVPGPPAVRPVYSPALVAFVGGGLGASVGVSFGGGSGGVAAWFPIGVGEPYVPWYHCTPTYARQVNVTNVNTAVIRNTTIVNNYNTYITNVHVTNVSNTTNVNENHFNYANRASVTAVPVTAMSSGGSVARQQVRLSPQQQQQLAQAPVSVRPTAPTPATPHPSLVAKANVSQPAARPVVMTPTGQTRAVPSAAHAQPVVVSRLPAPKVAPQNAPPPPQKAGVAPQAKPNQPAAMGVRPLQPAATGRPVSPGVSSPAPGQRPAATATGIQPNRPAQPAPMRGNEVVPNPAPAPVTRSVPERATPSAPVTPARPAPVRPNEVAPASATPVTRPAPIQRPTPAAAAVPPNQPVRSAAPARPGEAPTAPRPATPTPAAARPAPVAAKPVTTTPVANRPVPAAQPAPPTGARPAPARPSSVPAPVQRAAPPAKPVAPAPTPAQATNKAMPAAKTPATKPVPKQEPDSKEKSPQ